VASDFRNRRSAKRGFDDADVDALLDRVASAIANLDENPV
jgi:DivIVA domain-containing protein